MDNICFVCKDLMMVPRIYECGHTLCERCMKKSDQAEKNKIHSVFSVTSFSCAFCREKTLIPWYLRPINRILLDELRKNENYELEYKKYMCNHKRLDTKIPDNVNLSYLVQKNKKIMVEQLYNKILPLLFKASSDGKSFIQIDDIETCKQIQIVSDDLSKKLFDKNNIYKFLSTPRECTIEIIHSDTSYRNEFINDNHDVESSSIITESLIESNSDNDSDDVELRSSSRYITNRRMLSSIRTQYSLYSTTDSEPTAHA